MLAARPAGQGQVQRTTIGTRVPIEQLVLGCHINAAHGVFQAKYTCMSGNTLGEAARLSGEKPVTMKVLGATAALAIASDEAVVWSKWICNKPVTRRFRSKTDVSKHRLKQVLSRVFK